MPPSTDRPAPRILIVDDQPSNVRLLEHTLRRAGYAEVMSTVEPREVAALHRQHRYDLILLDLRMPEMNGFEVMEQLREIGEGVAILVMSAESAEMSAALEAGASSFLGKPFKLPDVVDRVRSMLETARPRDLEEPAPLGGDEHRSSGGH
ncbi:MAG TPA: response regulator [Thermoanaerobaculia bacterium]|nr:response regulator [Thermoanaerobaculia bacterium]